MSEDPRAVLLVEDNTDDAELTTRALKRAPVHHPIDVARDGQEALDYLFGTDEQPPRRVPALVLLDLKLPRVDGLDVLKRIRAEERTQRIPVVTLTSSTEDDDLIHAYDLGANSYVCKPIQWGEFTAAIEQLGVYWLTINQPPPPADDDAAPAPTPEPTTHENQTKPKRR